MSDTGVIGTLLLLVTAAATYYGFRDAKYFADNSFEVDPILVSKEYKRLISSGFLHTGWWHFGFNMIALASFSWSLELLFGYWKFLFIYFASMLGGNLLSLYIHRNHSDYRAVGASGAISGVIFSSILLFPTDKIHLILLPEELGIPGWLFGLLFIVISIYGIKGQKDNIGHEAHLGGALTGAIITLFFMPFGAVNWFVFAALILPTLGFLYLIVKDPSILMVEGYWGEHLQSIRKPKKRNKKTKIIPLNKQAELDILLEKIGKNGIDSLTSEEKERLDQLTKDI